MQLISPPLSLRHHCQLHPRIGVPAALTPENPSTWKTTSHGETTKVLCSFDGCAEEGRCHPSCSDNLRHFRCLQYKECWENEFAPSLMSKLSIVGAIVGVAALAVQAAAASTALATPFADLASSQMPSICSTIESKHDQRTFPMTRERDIRLRQHARLGKLSQEKYRYIAPATASGSMTPWQHSAIPHTCVLPRSHQPREVDGSTSGIDYERLIEEHSNTQMKRQMFTGDAWLGMMRLQRYNDLLDSVEEQEKLCSECIRNRRLLEQVWQTVSNEYFDKDGRFSQAEWSGQLFQTMNEAGGLLHTKAELYKAVKEMVAKLGDRYSSFLTPEEYRFALHRPIQSELKYLAYQYTGVGMEVGKRRQEGGFEIISPFAGSPAEEAGILGGETLLSVDGFSVNSLTAGEAVTLLRGPVGSLVELEITGSKSNPGAIKRLLLERRALPLPPLKMQMIDAGRGRLMAYLRLHYFTHDGTKRMASAIREGEALGVDGYILDLRNNPGGVFEEAIAMAALWLDCQGCDITGTVRSNAVDVDDFTYVAGKLPKTIFVRHPGVLTHAPLMTISNRNSASASEVLLGALHDNGRTFAIGEKTFGKGVVQYFFPMDDGSGLKLTVAKYLTPKRYDISKQGGLHPDKYCGDYPHAAGVSDECINEAVRRLQFMADSDRKEELRSGVAVPAAMPYRWLPLNEKKLWAKGFY